MWLLSALALGGKMKSLSQLALRLSKEIDWDSKLTDNYDPKEKTITQQLVELDNQRKGNLKEFDCELCLNRGFISYYDQDNDTSYIDDCECMKVRKSKKNAEESGMKELLSHKLRFFEATEPFQIDMREKAKDYILNAHKSKEWFLALGQSGCGKTHICSSICNERMTHYDEDLKRYTQVKYMIWNDFVDRIKKMNYDSDRDSYFDEFAKSEVLYIDDFLKGKFTDADLNLAFRLINYRYNNDLVTIISSELLMKELRAIDEAIAGRMKQKATNRYMVQIGRNENRNSRFKDEVIF